MKRRYLSVTPEFICLTESAIVLTTTFTPCGAANFNAVICISLFAAASFATKIQLAPIAEIQENATCP